MTQAWQGDQTKLLVPQVRLKGGRFAFGANLPVEGRSAPREVAGSGAAKRAKVHSFAIDATAVTNDQFRRFVRDTKYGTEAEHFGWSFVHELQLSAKTLAIADAEEGMGRIKDSPHWVAVEKAYWRKPEGPGSSIKDRGDHPVVHISYNDAVAYCKWANGRRLPTEKEWEFAARGGLDNEPFPWEGDEDSENMQQFALRMNGWQGDFPKSNTVDDGWIGTAPVTEYSMPNEYGMHNMLGNVWEWCQGGKNEARPLRGGSFVDSIDGRFNHALRVWTRMENTADSGSVNTGFRCVSSSNESMNLEEPPKAPEPGAARKKAESLDQNELQNVLAERGVEGLQEWLHEQGIGGNVMTAAQMDEMRAASKQNKGEL